MSSAKWRPFCLGLNELRNKTITQEDIDLVLLFWIPYNIHVVRVIYFSYQFPDIAIHMLIYIFKENFRVDCVSTV